MMIIMGIGIEGLNLTIASFLGNCSVLCSTFLSVFLWNKFIDHHLGKYVNDTNTTRGKIN